MTPEPHVSEVADATTALEVVRWWSTVHRDWFSQHRDFDVRFLCTHRRAAAELDDWSGSAEGALTLLILLDQFPRNAFWGTTRMYFTDAQTRVVARQAVNAGLDAKVDPALWLFFYIACCRAGS